VIYPNLAFKLLTIFISLTPGFNRVISGLSEFQNRFNGLPVPPG